MAGSDVAVVIPAYNEAETIAQVVRSVAPYGLPIVVDDRSSDDTGTIAAAAGATVVRHEMNLGYDGALNSGFAAAERLGCAYVVTMDADGQHDPQLIGVFATRLKEGNDLVIGVRPNHARLSETLFALYAQLRYRVRDPLCGMKGYVIGLYRERGWFDSYQSIGTELALYALRMRRPFAQVPISIAERNGPPRFARAVKADLKILRAMALSLVRA